MGIERYIKQQASRLSDEDGKKMWKVNVIHEKTFIISTFNAMKRNQLLMSFSAMALFSPFATLRISVFLR